MWYGPNSIWLQHEKSSGIISAFYYYNDVIFPLFHCVVVIFPLFHCVVWTNLLSGFSMRRAVALSVHSVTLMMSYFCFSMWYGPNSIWLQHEKSSGIISALCTLSCHKIHYQSLYHLYDVIFPLFQCVVSS